MNIGKMTNTGNNFGLASAENSTTLKGKLQKLEEDISNLKEIQNELQINKWLVYSA